MKQILLMIAVVMGQSVLAADKGKPLPKDFKSLKALAEKGNAEAQYNLGMMYDGGKEVKRDFKEAVKWVRKAADQGFAEAQLALGIAYRAGHGVEEDDKEGFKWIRKAANQGFAGAQLILGWGYFNGDGVPEDDVQAYAWFNIAAANGREKAKNGKSVVAKEMTPDQIAEGQKLSRKMVKKNPKLLK
jgi:TPR repeat protein